VILVLNSGSSSVTYRLTDPDGRRVATGKIERIGEAWKVGGMRVKDIMTHPVYSVRTVDPIEVAAKLRADRRITAAPVFDEAGELVGMVSEGALLWHRVSSDPTAHLRPAAADTDDRPRTVAEVMSGSPLTTWPEADVADVAQMMLEREVRSLPELEDDMVVGIVSRRDILRTVVRTDDVVRGDVQHRLDEYAGGDRRWTATVDDGVVTIGGDTDDEVEQTVVRIMARTIPGVADVKLAGGRAHATSCP
jgi:CBS domain-containing protein